MRKSLLLIPAAALAVIAGVFTAKPVDAKAADDFVIVLDPGHDATHVGSRGYGLKEEELNMKIALSCKSELEKYDGVKVYFTHPTLECVVPEGSSRDCLYSRPDYAKSVGASLYVSLHNNAGADVSGYEIYYPNANYVPEFNSEGEGLSLAISEKLSELGINNRGIYTRDSGAFEDDGTNWYADGSRADYYAVIRRSKNNGFPGIIIEHAYISNAADASLLGDDNMLSRMGQADAQGIAEYYGFVKKNSVIYNDYTNEWCMYKDGEIQYDYSGLAYNDYGWWKITDGVVDFSYTGIVYDEEVGWWYVENGAVAFWYNGLKNNDYGWWKITDGAVDFNYTGLAYDEEVGWWYVENGTVVFDYNGLRPNDYGWWKITNGAVDFDYTGLAYDKTQGWWYVENGKVDFDYNGIQDNEDGSWKITNGTIDYGYSGEFESDKHTYVISDGLVEQVKHPWDKGVIVTEATCDKDGVIRYTCTECGETKEEAIKAKGHDYSWVVTKPATAKEEGLEQYKCSVCGDVKETRKIEKLKSDDNNKADDKKDDSTSKDNTIKTEDKNNAESVKDNTTKDNAVKGDTAKAADVK